MSQHCAPKLEKCPTKMSSIGTQCINHDYEHNQNSSKEDKKEKKNKVKKKKKRRMPIESDGSETDHDHQQSEKTKDNLQEKSADAAKESKNNNENGTDKNGPVAKKRRRDSQSMIDNQDDSLPNQLEIEELQEFQTNIDDFKASKMDKDVLTRLIKDWTGKDKRNNIMLKEWILSIEENERLRLRNEALDVANVTFEHENIPRMKKQKRNPNVQEIKKEAGAENERLRLENEALNTENICFDYENIPLKKEPKEDIKAKLVVDDDDGIEIVEEIKKEK